MTYIKYAYWASPDVAAALGGVLKRQGRYVFKVRKAVCIPLAPKNELCFVPPEAWHTYEFCRRQYSWYETSPFYGQTLIVSDTELAEIEHPPETIITRKPDFVPPSLPDELQKQSLTRSPGYLEQKPPAWEDIDSEDPQKHERWLRIMGQGDRNFKDLFSWHCANHANFIQPRYALTTENADAPYSIGPTSTVCSACLEFYNIIGRLHPVKYVVPCPGAVLFAGLEKNVYYEVRSIQRPS